ncbi:MAG: hypothetical protein COB37_06060 [Kordiimonadales bacterium]|nr:MAG: hypothetical protein COB37_06060 [Kordiimonadales bacterium]
MKKKYRWMAAATVAVLAIGGCSFFPEGKYLLNFQYAEAETSEGTFTVAHLSNGASGRRVIFLHGTPGPSNDTMSNNNTKSTIEGLEFVIVHRLGWGRTTPRRPVTSLMAQAEAILPLLVEKDGKKPIIVGFSYGGPVAAMIAAKYGDKIGGMIQVAGAIDPDLEPDPHFMQNFGNLSWVSPFVPEGLHTANQELLTLEDELRLMAPMLERISAPTVVLHGTADGNVDYGNVDFMRARFSNAASLEIVTIEGGGHGAGFRNNLLFQAIKKLADEDFNTPVRDIKVDLSRCSLCFVE